MSQIGTAPLVPPPSGGRDESCLVADPGTTRRLRGWHGRPGPVTVTASRGRTRPPAAASSRLPPPFMFIKTLELENTRTFPKARLDFVHPDREYAPAAAPPGGLDGRLPRPRLPNVNLLVGDNGSGKTTVLRAIALAALA